MAHAELCPVCEGSGMWMEEPCHGCEGVGWITVSDEDPDYSFLLDEKPPMPCLRGLQKEYSFHNRPSGYSYSGRRKFGFGAGTAL